MYDIIVIGSGPAGLSAAITAAARGKSVAVISNSRTESGLFKAPVIDNYPGFPGVSGAELSGKLMVHAQGAGARILSGRVTSALSVTGGINVGYGSEFESGRALILALGIVQTHVFPGEAELLGRGVSYCATCDGMLYRGKKVVVVSLAPDAPEEAEYLRSIGCDVTEVTTTDVVIFGVDRVQSVTADGVSIPCDGVFVLRRTVAPATLLSGLETADGHIAVNDDFSTSVPGVFAAGDCVGPPYQIAKAVGEGQLAAFAAIAYIDRG
ncbi:MAG: NAD(P)/FAD-dependent oxidoreductase [Oscillospiraceae bacterium]|jgi:thioredoxin reductase (NADPH)|nr:NAD(P)/FAD-dependent oxidoreductase [Oscillospiraceae bacterium]